jgi:hypothetical protein
VQCAADAVAARAAEARQGLRGERGQRRGEDVHRGRGEAVLPSRLDDTATLAARGRLL